MGKARAHRAVSGPFLCPPFHIGCLSATMSEAQDFDSRQPMPWVQQQQAILRGYTWEGGLCNTGGDFPCSPQSADKPLTKKPHKSQRAQKGRLQATSPSFSLKSSCFCHCPSQFSSFPEQQALPAAKLIVPNTSLPRAFQRISWSIFA